MKTCQIIPGLSPVLEKNVRNICNHGRKVNANLEKNLIPKKPFKCHLVHHSKQFLRLGPFPFEIKRRYPFRAIFHHFFTEKEMNYIKFYSAPRLSLARSSMGANEHGISNENSYKHMNTEKNIIQRKAVITSLYDLLYINEEVYKKTQSLGTISYQVTVPKNPYEFIIFDNIMYRISNRIELYTTLNITKRRSSTLYQATNYGLAGSVSPHMDAWGYEKGKGLIEEKKTLAYSGDTIATFMGWLSNTEAGGLTALPYGSEYFVPIKGAAAFWINLSSCHTKDQRTWHSGCPVLKGSKWILNKWIQSFDQWNILPCYEMPLATIHMFKDTTDYY